MIDDEILNIFLDEVADILNEWERICLDFQTGDDIDIDSLFRCAHNLKGSSKSVGLNEFGDFVHKVEDIIGAIVSGKITKSSEVFNVLLRAQGILAGWVEELKIDSSHVENSINFFEDIKDFSNIDVQNEIVVVENEAESKEKNDELADVKESEVPVENKNTLNVILENTEKGEVKAPKVKRDESVRVSAEKIDSLIQLIGEMSVQMSIIKHGQSTCELDGTTYKAIELGDKICREIQNESFSLRMQPLKNIFQKLERIVNDLANSLGKVIEVVFEGADVELDKLIIEAISDPLVHIVRNAVDHGIENLEERLDTGKDGEAIIRIIAKQDPTGVILTISDDGRGMDSKIIRNKAIEKGIISSDSHLSEQEITQLIFMPGFSTAVEVTDVSGRGVGMDVVKRSVDSIKGTIEVDTTFGEGSEFNIKLPTSLSIIDALMIQVDGEVYAVPLLDVSEIIELENHTKEEKVKIIDLRGDIVPIENLCSYFPITKSQKKNKGTEEKSRNSRPALIINANRNIVAFEVDQVIGQNQIVVKKFNDYLSPLVGFSGSCIMSDGEAGMIIELKKIAEGYVNSKTISRGQDG